MNLNLLKAFLTVAQEKSFSKAAERLFISQPALSQNIKQLERHFSVTLLNRTPHDLTLTAAGNILVKHAAGLLSSAEQMEEAMGAFTDSFNKVISVGTTSAVGGFAVPCSIFIFKNEHPAANIKLKLGNRQQILEQLDKNLFDIAIVEGSKPRSILNSTEIHREEMVVVAPNKPEWKINGTLSLPAFCASPFITREQGSATRSTIEKTLQQAGMNLTNLNIIMELDSVDSIKAAVEAGHGISILPRIAVRKELYNHTLLPLTVDTLSFLQPVYVVHKKKDLPIAGVKFCEFMKSSNKGFC